MNHSHMTNFLAVLPERFWLTCELIIYDEFACRSGVNGFCLPGVNQSYVIRSAMNGVCVSVFCACS